jgi:flagellar biosynthesis protein FlhA
MAALTGGAAFMRHRHPPVTETPVVLPSSVPSEPPITEALKIDTIRLELGYG